MPDSKVTKLQDPRELILSFPVAANAVISIGDMVVISATGFAQRPTEATGLLGAGFAVEAKDNTGGADGAIQVRVSTAPHAVPLEAGTLDASDLQSAVYAVDESTVDGDDDGGSRSAFGTLVYVDSAGQLFVRPTAGA